MPVVPAVVQDRERIVFGVDEDGVEVHVQVQYSGDVDEFAWIVPVAGVPDIGLSTPRLFQVLPQVTAPRFNLIPKTLGNACVFPTQNDDDTAFGVPDSVDTADSVDADDTGDTADSGVTVVGTGTAGAYTWSVLSATSESALRSWLTDAGFDIPEGLSAPLAGYIASEQYFVAIQLVPGARQGDLLPLRMRYDADRPSIPLVLTGIAAAEDMRIETHILAAHRAVPENYLHLEINEATLDWEQRGSNYLEVVRRAADEAGGQGWVTDMAGPISQMQSTIFNANRFDMTQVRGAEDGLEAVGWAIIQWGVLDALMLELVADHVDPDGTLAPADLLAWIQAAQCAANGSTCGFFDTDAAFQGETVDVAAFADDFDARMVQPLVEVQDLLDRFDYVTRMTSSMSPDEMTIDPVFRFAPDQGDVSPLREAIQVTDCRLPLPIGKAPRWIELSDGRVLRLPTSDQGWSKGRPTHLDEGPQTITMDRFGTDGQPVLVRDQSADADVALAAYNAWMKENYPWGGALLQDDVDKDTPAGRAADCGGCASTPTGSLAAFSLLLLTRRRRRAG